MTSTPLHDALAARDAAFAQLDAADWKQETKDIVAVILTVASERPTFSANDVRLRLPDDVNPNRIGRAFVVAQEHDWIRKLDHVRSNALSTRGAEIGTYCLVVAASEVAA